MKEIRPLTVSLFLIFSAFRGNAQRLVTNQQLSDTQSYILDHYAQRTALFTSEPIVTGKIMFLGNSITEGGDWKRLLGDSDVINRGIGGDIAFGVLKRMNDVVRRKPAKLFLLIGINDISKDIPDTVIAENVRKIIQIVGHQSAATKIYLQSVLPINPDVPNFPQHYDKEVHVIHLNKILRKIASEEKVTFINLFPNFLDSKGRLDSRVTGDGLHLNEKGYQIWVAYLKKKGFVGK